MAKIRAMINKDMFVNSNIRIINVKKYTKGMFEEIAAGVGIFTPDRPIKTVTYTYDRFLATMDNVTQLFPLYELDPKQGEIFSYINGDDKLDIVIDSNYREFSKFDSVSWLKNEPVVVEKQTNKTYSTLAIGEFFVIPANDPLTGRYSDGKNKISDKLYREGKKLNRKFKYTKNADGSIKVERIL